MSMLKNFAISFATTAIAIAIIVRVKPIRDAVGL